MRSIELNHLKTNLSNINSNLSHYIFAHEQFLIDNRKNVKQYPNKFTNAIYASNPFSSQFNVKIHEIEEHSLKTSCFIYDSFLLFCFLELENYLKEIYKRIQLIQNEFNKKGSRLKIFSNELKDLNTNRTLETVLVNLELAERNNSGTCRLVLRSTIYLSQEDLDTLEYLRLRRNTLIHRDINERLKGAIAAFIDEEGKKLNEYWEKINLEETPKMRIYTLKFDNRDLILKSYKEVVDIINIIRYTCKKVDRAILHKIEKEEWIRYLFWCFKEEVRIFDYSNLNRFVAKFNGYTKQKLNIDFTQDIIKETLKSNAEVAQW